VTSSTETDLSAYFRRRRKTPEHKRRRLLKKELEREEMKTRKDKFLNMKETMTEDGNKLGWANSFIKLSRHEIKFGIDSILDTAATPQD
jgi:hypothetical protein